MNTDDFEQRLQRQPMRQMPADWRDEILRKAAQAQAASDATPAPRPLPWWKELLWPCPQAWAGLAAAWLIIFVLNVESRSTQTIPMAKNSTSAPEVIATWREQQRLMAELVDGRELPVAEPPKIFRPGPRSDYRREEQAIG